MFPEPLESSATAYGHNIRGFKAYVPGAFGSDTEQMEKYYKEIYLCGSNPRIPVSLAKIAGAAAFKAVQQHDSRSSSPPLSFNSDSLQNENHYSHEVNKIQKTAAQEVLSLLQMFPLPNVDPAIIVLSAEAGAHRLYDQYNVD
ncbi:hypothetical protein Glove_759g13 [Diversispora epigaea]|uniref:Uncharacterized protein n=1 Tax=Diversispora epigaea TaxID=1348612 RepID=A0A397G203_9GLOM|nr:hypothetical protein Glove_759g13 [Diversispora epigaea]